MLMLKKIFALIAATASHPVAQAAASNCANGNCPFCK
jgi:hypothetical protein